MRVLLIKTSSMGDLIHTFPALTDARNAIPDLSIDWVVEESFKEIPAWHPVVNKVIPVALRRWRKNIFSHANTHGMAKITRMPICKQQHYDLVLDAQGLAKSAFLSFFAKGIRAGLDFHSAREPLASFAYQRKYPVNFYQHAVVRMRNLFSQALEYTSPNTPPDFQINREQFAERQMQQENLCGFFTWHDMEIKTMAGNLLVAIS